MKVNKADATLHIEDGVMGISKPGDLANECTLKDAEDQPVGGNNVTYVYGVRDASSKAPLTDAQGVYVNPGVVDVTVSLPTATVADNYNILYKGTALSATGTTDTDTVFTAQATIKETSYKVTTESSRDGSYTATQGGTALDVKYADGGIATAVANGIKVNDGAVTWTPVYYYEDGTTQVVDKSGNNAAPTLPGKYKVAVKLGNTVLGTVPMTVYVDLDTMVNTQAGQKPMTVTVGGRYVGTYPAPNNKPNVKIPYTDGMTAQNALDSIQKGMTVTLASGGKQVPIDLAGNLQLTSGQFTAGEKATDNYAKLVPASDNGVYRNELKIGYAYGDDFPAVSLKADKATFKNAAFNVSELLNFGTSADPGVGVGYNVVATLMNGSEPAVKADGSLVYQSKSSKDSNDPAVDATIKNAGTYKIEVIPAGDYVGDPAPMYFTIDPLPVSYGKNGNFDLADVSGMTLANGSYSATFTGEPIKPSATVKVAEVPVAETTDPKDPKDYTVAYGENTDVAQGGTVTYAFTGNYSGTVTVPFSITPASLFDLGATVKADNQLVSEFENTVEGVQVELPGPGGKVLKEGVDYTVEGPTRAANQTDPDATRYNFTVRGMGNYSSANSAVKTGSFLVTDKTIEGMYDVVVKEGSVYNPYGEAKPAVTVYEKGTKNDVTKTAPIDVAYENNVNATTEDAPAYAVVTGTGQYAGSIKVPFQIAPLELSDASNVKGSVKLVGAEGLVYNGKEQVPDVSIKDSKVTPVNKDRDNTPIPLKDVADDVAFGHEGGVNAGTSYVTVVPKNGNFTGQVKVPYEIAPAELAADNVAVAGSTAPGADAAVS
ncbi:hypothetical protein, partial [Xiamenia xianingshaonis]